MKLLFVFMAAAFYNAPAALAASVDGTPVHYTATGTGPTVLFVHGWTCDETSWSEQVPALAPHYRAVTIDLPGHGQSPAPSGEKLSMDYFARAVESVRAELAADRVTLVGHSMGAIVITEYARLYPAHTAALVLVDGVVSVGGMAGHPPDGSHMKGPAGLKYREANTRTMFSAATTPALQAKIIRMMQAAPESTAIQAMQAMYDASVWKNAGVLSMPILAIYADHSRLANRVYMRQHFPHLEYNEIPGTGHFLMLEKPAPFNRLLLAFLAKHAL